MNKKKPRLKNLAKQPDKKHRSSVKQLGSLSDILNHKNNLLKSKKTPKQLGSLSSILAATSPPKTKNKKYRLLDHYLKSPLPSTPAKTYKSIDLSKLIGQNNVKPTIKQLGSLSNILTSHSSAQLKQPVSSDQSPTNFYPKSNSKHHRSTKNYDSFKSAKKPSSSPLKNLSFSAIGIFFIGICIFALNQLIKNANLNFASQNSSPSTNLNTPYILTFQGRLTDYDRNSITQLKNMKFTMYNTSGGNTPPPIGGKILWDSGLCQISPSQHGVFTVNLGAGAGQNQDNANCGATLGNIFTENSSIWLQITVENEVLFPRQLIKSVPYALNSETLQGFPASQSATPNTIPVLDEQGNLKFNTTSTSLINSGHLSLISQTGDLLLLPGSGNVYIGYHEAPAHLIISGDATISGNLNLSLSSESNILFGENGLHFKSQIGQNLWLNQLSITQQGYLGIGTTTPQQKLSLNQGNIQFIFDDGPEIGNLKLSEDIVDLNALTRLPAPTKNLHLHPSSIGHSHLSPGKYQYAYTFITENGTESNLSPITTIEIQESQSILINDIEIYPLTNVVARKIYRTKANDDRFYFLKTINDNLSTSTIDISHDASLNQSLKNYNNTGNYRYKITFTTSAGESMPSLTSEPIKINGDGRVVKIENIPLSSNDQGLISRNLYRSLADSQQYYLIASISDNTTTTIYDNLNDLSLIQQRPLKSAGGIYANQSLSIQLQSDGSIITENNLIANQRVETKHGENQGLKLPTSLGKPQIQIGQQIGDIVYDNLNQLLYVYNGQDFVSTSINSTSTTIINNSNDSNYCSENKCRLTFEPEYPGAVITGDGHQNDGIYSSGTETINTNHRLNYYQWLASSPILQDFDTTINLVMPQNFHSWQTQGLTLDYLTQDTDHQNNAINFEIYNNQNGLSFSKVNQVSSLENFWMSHLNQSQPLTITHEELSTLNLKGGDRLTLIIKTLSKDNNQVKIGQINLNYHSTHNSANQDQSIWRQTLGAISPSNSQSDFLLGGDSTASAKIAFINLAGSNTPTLYLKGNLFLDNPSKKNYLDLAAQSSLNIRTQNSDQTYNEVFTILPNGNIGLGTTNPTEKLEVVGNVKINGSLQLSPLSQLEAGPCNQQTEGKIYYDYEQLKFFACQALSTSRQAFAWTPLN